jgi:mannosyltransferase OCH1-like enzyme
MTSALSLRSGYFPYLAAVLVLGTVLLYFLVVGNSLGLENYHVVPVITPSDAIKFKDDHHIFPHLVHQMWKTKDSLTTDFKRWRSGCSRLNKEYAFHLYDDNDLKLFTHQHYPEYSALFDSLKGVCKFLFLSS